MLVARNQLAESEANRLSQFNAEILAHNNPAQRIVYLDRVRRELAETKQVRFCPSSLLSRVVPRGTLLHHGSSSGAHDVTHYLIYSCSPDPSSFRC